MWTARELDGHPERWRYKPCPSCRLYIDNRNWRRHAKACAAKARKHAAPAPHKGKA